MSSPYSNTSSHVSDSNNRQTALQDGFEELDRVNLPRSSTSSSLSFPEKSQPLSDDSQYISIGAPYAACPLVTPHLHLPVPTAVHHFFPDQRQLDQDVHPYPFRLRAPSNGRLARKRITPTSSSYQLLQNPNTYQDDDQAPFKKRHSLGNGQIDRLVQKSRQEVNSPSDKKDYLEDRIHWLTRGYYVVHPEQDTTLSE